MATLTILEILGGYITNFYTLVAKLKIGDNFGRVYIYIYIYSQKQRRFDLVSLGPLGYVRFFSLSSQIHTSLHLQFFSFYFIW